MILFAIAGYIIFVRHTHVCVYCCIGLFVRARGSHPSSFWFALSFVLALSRVYTQYQWFIMFPQMKCQIQFVMSAFFNSVHFAVETILRKYN